MIDLHTRNGTSGRKISLAVVAILGGAWRRDSQHTNQGPPAAQPGFAVSPG